MPINPLYGYDTGQYGYGQANRPQDTPLIGSVTGRRQYPAWMTDPMARGIGVAQTNVYAPPPPMAIPQGDGGGGFNNQNVLPQQQLSTQGYAPPPEQWMGAEGSNATGDLSGQGNNQPAPPGLSDILGALGLSTGQFGGSAGSNIDNQGKSGDFGAMNDLAGFGGDTGGDTQGGKGDIGGGAAQGDPGAMNGFYTGGVVTPNRLRGPNPPGPDDGYAPLDVGEGVLTAAAMKHYGPAFLRRLNKLQVPKGR